MRPLSSVETRPAIVLASHNAGKVSELRDLLAGAGLALQVLGLDDLPAHPVPDETGTSFEENALIKARDAALVHGLPALADDSGIEVDALNGMPGIRSARWAGADASDHDNLQLLLRQIDDVPDDRRTGRFVSAVALVIPRQTVIPHHTGIPGERAAVEHVVRAEWEGRLAREPRGENGFGYDPIFLPDDAPGTSAELSPADKNAISHRGQAFAKIVSLLATEVVEGER